MVSLTPIISVRTATFLLTTEVDTCKSFELVLIRILQVKCLASSLVAYNSKTGYDNNINVLYIHVHEHNIVSSYTLQREQGRIQIFGRGWARHNNCT